MGLPIHCNPSNTLNFHFKQKLNRQKTQGSILLPPLVCFFFFFPASASSPGFLPLPTTCSLLFSVSCICEIQYRNDKWCSRRAEKEDSTPNNWERRRTEIDIYRRDNLDLSDQKSRKVKTSNGWLMWVIKEQWGGEEEACFAFLSLARMENTTQRPFGFPCLLNTCWYDIIAAWKKSYCSFAAFLRLLQLKIRRFMRLTDWFFSKNVK